MNTNNTSSCNGTWWKKPWGMLGIGLLGGGFFYLAIFHWHYVGPYLPFLIFLACPLSHFFMHHGHDRQNGHGGHGCCGGGHDKTDDKAATEPTRHS